MSIFKKKGDVVTLVPKGNYVCLYFNGKYESSYFGSKQDQKNLHVRIRQLFSSEELILTSAPSLEELNALMEDMIL